MRDISYIVALLSILVLIGSAVAWQKVLREPELQPVTGRVDPNSGAARSAALAIIIAFGLSATAAVIAIFGWFDRT